MRKLLLVPMGLLGFLSVGFVVGVGAQLPFLMIFSLMCLTPLFLVTLGFAFGKASNQYRFLVPKDAQPVIQQQRARRPAATYDVGAGDIRGN
jgi:hypothetical protein